MTIAPTTTVDVAAYAADAVLARAPLTREEVFPEGQALRTNGGPDGIRFYFDGHLTAGELQQITEEYGLTGPHKEIVAGSVEQAWHLFTAHSGQCYLFHAEGEAEMIADGGAEPGNNEPNSDSCICEAAPLLRETHRGWEYRHPLPATVGTPGAVPVTWATIDWTAESY